MGCGRAYGTNQKKGTKGTNRHRFPKTERVGRPSKTKVKSPTLARTNGARMGHPSGQTESKSRRASRDEAWNTRKYSKVKLFCNLSISMPGPTLTGQRRGGIDKGKVVGLRTTNSQFKSYKTALERRRSCGFFSPVGFRVLLGGWR
jgi:hypothetical protein